MTPPSDFIIQNSPFTIYHSPRIAIFSPAVQYLRSTGLQVVIVTGLYSSLGLPPVQ
jgi:hypothetical protein